jgi:hypothetical protein
VEDLDAQDGDGRQIARDRGADERLDMEVGSSGRSDSIRVRRFP